MKLLIFVAVAAVAMMSPHANAADPVMVATNSNPVVAKGNGFEIRQSEVDKMLATAKANNPQEELPADAEVRVVAQLIEMQLVLQKATEEEKAEGKKNADEKFAQISKTLSATEFERRLKATHMTADDLRHMLGQEDTAQASLTRQLGIKVTDADAKKWFDDHPGLS